MRWIFGSPGSGVRIVTTFGRFGINVSRVLNISPAIGANVAKFAVFTDLNLIFVDKPIVFKSRFFNCFQ